MEDFKEKLLSAIEVKNNIKLALPEAELTYLSEGLCWAAHIYQSDALSLKDLNRLAELCHDDDIHIFVEGKGKYELYINRSYYEWAKFK